MLQLGRILLQRIFLLKNCKISKEFCSVFPNHDIKYGEISKRLAAVPYFNLLNKELTKIHHDVAYENDERLKQVQEWSSKVFDYNVRDGKQFRAVAFLKAYCVYGFNIDDDTWKQWDSERWRLAATLAWCIEMLQAFLLIQDDIVDNSVLRRGKPCWYTKQNIGLNAVNDSLLILFGIHKLLKKHFFGLKCYKALIQEIMQVTHQAVYGQCMDIMYNSIDQKSRFAKFTSEYYKTIVEYKTANYTFRLPVHLAMHFSGGYSLKEYNFARKCTLKIGIYFQIQDDGLDCFGDPGLTGKFGNDIRKGKCTWFSVKFLEKAPELLKKKFLENYGVDDNDAIFNVLELYKKSNLSEKFEEHYNKIFDEICTLIESQNDVKGILFYDLLAQLQKREK